MENDNVFTRFIKNLDELNIMLMDELDTWIKNQPVEIEHTVEERFNNLVNKQLKIHMDYEIQKMTLGCQDEKERQIVIDRFHDWSISYEKRMKALIRGELSKNPEVLQKLKQLRIELQDRLKDSIPQKKKELRKALLKKFVTHRLFSVIEENNVDLAKEILDHIPDLINVRIDNGRLPLHVATSKLYPEMVSMLIERGACLFTEDCSENILLQILEKLSIQQLGFSIIDEKNKRVFRKDSKNTPLRNKQATILIEEIVRLKEAINEKKAHKVRQEQEAQDWLNSPRIPLKKTAVNSDSIVSIGYRDGTLQIEYQEGGLSQYFCVAPTVYLKLTSEYFSNRTAIFNILNFENSSYCWRSIPNIPLIIKDKSKSKAWESFLGTSEQSKEIRRFFHAIEHNRVKKIKTYVKAKPALAEITGPDDIKPLHWAVWLGAENVIKYLIALGVDVNPWSNFCLAKGTPLHIALEEHNENIVLYLLDNGADITIPPPNNNSLVYLAVNNGHYYVVLYLIDKGVDLNVRDGYGHTTLDIAIIEQNTEIAKLLIAHGAKTYQGLHHSKWIFENLDENPELIEFIVVHGFNDVIQGYWDYTPLHIAVEYGCLNIASILIEHGADVNAVMMNYDSGSCSEYEGKYVTYFWYDYVTPLHIARKYKNIQMEKLLIQHGADHNICDLRDLIESDTG
jgi:FOG: Ankyrin repeat